jgi:hypothetical protein
MEAGTRPARVFVTERLEALDFLALDFRALDFRAWDFLAFDFFAAIDYLPELKFSYT